MNFGQISAQIKTASWPIKSGAWSLDKAIIKHFFEKCLKALKKENWIETLKFHFALTSRQAY